MPIEVGRKLSKPHSKQWSERMLEKKKKILTLSYRQLIPSYKFLEIPAIKFHDDTNSNIYCNTGKPSKRVKWREGGVGRKIVNSAMVRRAWIASQAVLRA